MWSARPIDSEPYADLPVRVDLDVLYGAAPDDVEPWPGGHLRDALVLPGTVPGPMRLWARAVDDRRPSAPNSAKASGDQRGH